MSDGPHSSRDNELAVGKAIKALKEANIQFSKKSPWHIKVGPFNYFPAKKTIYRDQETKARPERGIEAFIRMVRYVEYGEQTASHRPIIKI